MATVFSGALSCYIIMYMSLARGIQKVALLWCHLSKAEVPISVPAGTMAHAERFVCARHRDIIFS